MVMLAQAAGDREILARQLGISPHQLSYVTHSGSGEAVYYEGGLSKTLQNIVAAGSFVAECAA